MFLGFRSRSSHSVCSHCIYRNVCRFRGSRCLPLSGNENYDNFFAYRDTVGVEISKLFKKFYSISSHTLQVRYKEFEENGVVKKIEMKTPESRVVNSLSNVLWPMVQSAFSTLLCVLPLAILQVSIISELYNHISLFYRTTCQWCLSKPYCWLSSGECSMVWFSFLVSSLSSPCLFSTRLLLTCSSEELPLLRAHLKLILRKIRWQKHRK